MELSICRNCKKGFDKKSSICPFCATKKIQFQKYILLGLIIFAGFSVMLFLDRKNIVNGSRANPTSQMDLVSNHRYDGSVFQVEKYLRKNLKDPDSYEPMEWSPVTKMKDGGYMVRHKFRAKNSFSGYVIEEKIFIINSSGEVTGTIPE